MTDPDALQTLLDLEGDVHLRVFETAQTGVSFHPKSYLFHDRDGRATAYVGSSNLSRSALTEGVEWNYRVLDEPEGLRQAQQAFERLFAHPATVPLTQDWLHHYRGRFTYAARPLAEVGMVREAPQPVPQPHAIQQEALDALEATRAANHTSGLVVLATGLGKTWLAAFDSGNFRRVLFVAHREEILNQARATFRRIRPRARLGLFTGREKAPEADILFASIQTLGKASHQQLFEPTAFDYIVVDEFHHASARTYRSLLDYFEPRFLLGLTATPERSDGGDLLALCGQNLVYRCDLHRGIHDGQLSPLAYFGVPDEVDYANIPWRNARFDAEALTSALATRARAENALTHYRSHAGQRTIAFCCSQLHSDFMADFFARAGLRAVSVHSGPTTAPRSDSLERLNRGELDILCCVDMFNEGVDLPRVDTVMMLRPTESRVLWLQQLGRGLRKSADKERLVVIDYIGNHRTFLRNVSTLLEELAGVNARSDAELRGALAELDALSLPPGCSVTYDLSAVDVLRGLLRNTRGEQALLDYYHDFSVLHEARPTAVEAYHDGYNPRAVARTHGSWLGFVASLGGLDAGVFSAHRDFLEAVEKAANAPSLLVVSCALSGGRARFARVAARLGLTLEYDTLAKDWLATKWFVREGDEVVAVGLSGVSDLLDEVVDWRLAEYLD
ncbi:MAG: DEAD/DEAH box helicase family protein, partial [Candidatus Eremiobacteraeota bacterium]|nr:DEAD/DEAH box helicase family protein [Candidatus Eremiobacteraeota bacterium]